MSPNPWNVPPYGALYVANLTDLKALSRGSSSVGMPGNSTTSIPAGKSICLAAGTGYAEVVAKNKAYQVINTGVWSVYSISCYGWCTLFKVYL